MKYLDGIIPVFLHSPVFLLCLFPTGQFSCQVWRDPLREPALVHPRSVHRDTTLPQGQDEEEGEEKKMFHSGSSVVSMASIS